MKELLSDIKELKPTIFVSVPRLLNRVYDKASVQWNRSVVDTNGPRKCVLIREVSGG